MFHWTAIMATSQCCQGICDATVKLLEQWNISLPVGLFGLAFMDHSPLATVSWLQKVSIVSSLSVCSLICCNVCLYFPAFYTPDFLAAESCLPYHQYIYISIHLFLYALIVLPYILHIYYEQHRPFLSTIHSFCLLKWLGCCHDNSTAGIRLLSTADSCSWWHSSIHGNSFSGSLVILQGFKAASVPMFRGLDKCNPLIFFFFFKQDDHVCSCLWPSELVWYAFVPLYAHFKW